MQDNIKIIIEGEWFIPADLPLRAGDEVLAGNGDFKGEAFRRFRRRNLCDDGRRGSSLICTRSHCEKRKSREHKKQRPVCDSAVQRIPLPKALLLILGRQARTATKRAEEKRIQFGNRVGRGGFSSIPV